MPSENTAESDTVPEINSWQSIIDRYKSHIDQIEPRARQVVKRYGINQQETLTLNTASIGKQLDYIRNNYFPDLTDPEWEKFVTDYAICGSGDGNKISLIDQTKDLGAGKTVADSIIDCNQAIIHTAAERAGYVSVIMTYSGDEFAYILLPKTHHPEAQSPSTQDFVQTANELMSEVYSAPEFLGARKVLAKYFPDSRLGFTLNPIARLNTIYFYDPSSGNEIIPKRVVGAIIDGSRQSTHPSYSLAIKQLLKIDTDEENSHIYPNGMEVSESATSFAKTQEYFQKNIEAKLYFIKVANINVKNANKESHALGDHEIIATANLIRRLAKELDVTGYLNIEQRFGSFMLTLDEESYRTLQPYLADTAFLNSYYHLRDQARDQRKSQDPTMRANPFLVATTKIEGKPVTIDRSTTREKYYELINEFKAPQALKELASLVVYTGLANSWPSAIIECCNLLISSIEGSPLTDSQALKESYRLAWLNQFIIAIHDYRPDIFERILIPSILPNYRKMFSKLPSLIAQLARQKS